PSRVPRPRRLSPAFPQRAARRRERRRSQPSQPDYTLASQMIRLFVAIRMPAKVQRALAAEQRRLAAAGVGLRWVRPESIHLTLVFLGNVAAERVPAIEAAMQAAAAEAPPLRLAVRGLGCFPPRGAPRVLWAG